MLPCHSDWIEAVMASLSKTFIFCSKPLVADKKALVLKSRDSYHQVPSFVDNDFNEDKF